MTLQIELAPHVAIELQTAAIHSRGKEFSGFGFVEKRESSIYVYHVEILDIGTETFTELKPEKILPLMQRPDRQNMRLWLHAHPMGGNVPGPFNWSGTDERSIQETPMAGDPEMVGWSCSIVLTAMKVWVGRIDNHKTKQTVHVPVVGQAEHIHSRMQVLWGEMVARTPQSTWRTFRVETKSDEEEEILPFGEEEIEAIEALSDYESPDTSDGQPTWEDYQDRDRYLKALCDYYGIDLEELEVERNGEVWWGASRIGKVKSLPRSEHAKAQQLSIWNPRRWMK